MSLRVAIQMDPLSTVKTQFDTSFALGEVAQARGMTLFHYGPQDLSYREGRVVARVRPMTLTRGEGEPGALGEAENVDLATDVDVILMRQDPPFDMGYITACHLLEMLAGRTLVLNDPASVRSCPEKIFPLMFPELMPPTLVSRDEAEITDFYARYGDVVLKPLYSYGGKGIFRIKPHDSNLGALLEMFLNASREPVMVQAFLPAVSEGDKRIILIDGEAVGGFDRIPLGDDARSNMRVGGTARASRLSDADMRICNAIGPELKRLGLVLVGLDVIGGRLTEVNVTSPTGVQVLKRFDGIDAASLFWDAVERRLAARKG